MKAFLRSRRTAFTLIELLVVVAIIALLISILLPALTRARDQTKAVKCLSNLRTLGQGVISYATGDQDLLPGGLHQALYRNLKDPNYPPQDPNDLQRQLVWLLRSVYGDTHTMKNSVSDQVATCPAAASINPDSNFDRVSIALGYRVFPTHYAVNNYGGIADNVGPTEGQRTTNPPLYFGFSAWKGAPASIKKLEKVYPRQPWSKIKRPAEEWMIADAWFRFKPDSWYSQFRQAGPYQVEYTGNALPNFAPHFSMRRSYLLTTADVRNAESAQISDGKQDGRTNTVFFDGHAAAVASKTLVVDAGGGDKWPMLYGFPGTVNPLLPSDMPLDDPIRSAFWE